MVFRIRELLIRQRTQAINALRGHLTEFGLIVPQGAANAVRLIAIVKDPDNGLPADAVATLTVLVAMLLHLEAEIGKLNAEIERRAKEDAVARRLMTVPGIGPLIATSPDPVSRRLRQTAPCPPSLRRPRDRDGLRRCGRSLVDTTSGHQGPNDACHLVSQRDPHQHWRLARQHTAEPCARLRRRMAVPFDDDAVGANDEQAPQRSLPHLRRSAKPLLTAC